MRAGEIAFLVLLASFLIGFCLLGQFYYGYSPQLVLFPALIAAVTTALVAVQLTILVRSRQDGATLGRLSQNEVPAQLVRLGWLFSILPFILILGYPAGFALYLLFTLRRAGEGWPVALGVAGGSLLASWGLFVALLGVPLPLLPSWWPL